MSHDVRLIDANKLARWIEINKADTNPLDYNTRATYAECITMVSAMETIDAEPTRHAHWIWCETYLDGEPEYPCELLKEGWICSACGAYLMEYLQSHFHDIPSYAECISDEMPTIERCPCCGAKMDQEV